MFNFVYLLLSFVTHLFIYLYRSFFSVFIVAVRIFIVNVNVIIIHLDITVINTCLNNVCILCHISIPAPVVIAPLLFLMLHVSCFIPHVILGTNILSFHNLRFAWNVSHVSRFIVILRARSIDIEGTPDHRRLCLAGSTPAVTSCNGSTTMLWETSMTSY